MRLAWNAALAKGSEWDFYLLLNDDTDLLDCTWDELIGTHLYSLAHYGKGGVYSGITSAKSDHGKMTYGGDVWVNRLLAKSQRLKPTGTPQRCDMTNANILESYEVYSLQIQSYALVLFRFVACLCLDR